jgi:hypothetical protein
MSESTQQHTVVSRTKFSQDTKPSLEAWPHLAATTAPKLPYNTDVLPHTIQAIQVSKHTQPGGTPPHPMVTCR